MGLSGPFLPVGPVLSQMDPIDPPWVPKRPKSRPTWLMIMGYTRWYSIFYLHSYVFVSSFVCLFVCYLLFVMFFLLCLLPLLVCLFEIQVTGTPRPLPIVCSFLCLLCFFFFVVCLFVCYSVCYIFRCLFLCLFICHLYCSTTSHSTSGISAPQRSNRSACEKKSSLRVSSFCPPQRICIYVCSSSFLEFWGWFHVSDQMMTLTTILVNIGYFPWKCTNLSRKIWAVADSWQRRNNCHFVFRDNALPAEESLSFSSQWKFKALQISSQTDKEVVIVKPELTTKW